MKTLIFHMNRFFTVSMLRNLLLLIGGFALVALLLFVLINSPA